FQPECQGSIGSTENVRRDPRGYAGRELAHDVDVGPSQIKVVEMTVRDRVPLELVAVLPVDQRAYGDRRRLRLRDRRSERPQQCADDGHPTCQAHESFQGEGWGRHRLRRHWTATGTKRPGPSHTPISRL